MDSKKPPDTEFESGPASISDHANDSIRRFVHQLEVNFADTRSRNSPRLKRWRSIWMRIVILAEEREADLYCQLVADFPTTFPISAN